jgi:hypothetical protein
MRVVDDVVLAALEATGVTIHDGLVEVDNSTKVVTYPLPFAVYYSSLGDEDRDDNPRLVDVATRRSVFITLIYVGEDRRQAKWAGEKIRAALSDKRFVIPGYRTWKCRLEESQRIRRDDDAARPDGSPLFYGVDNYALSVTLTH